MTAKPPRKQPRPIPSRPVARPEAGGTRWPVSLAAILIATFVAYLPSLGNGYVHWDDNYYVTENPLLARPSLGGIFTTPVAANWHPLTIASLVVNYRLSGTDPASYHWLNLLLHLANTALVFLFVRALSRGRFLTTTITALFFGIHPMHVESVAWIAERKDVLYALFYLVALLAYLRYVDGSGRRWLWASVAATALSIASKPAAVVLPLSLVAIDFLRRRPWNVGLALEKAPFLALSIAGGIANLVVQLSFGALEAPRAWTLVERGLFASYALVVYVAKSLVPVRLSAVYPYPSTAVRSLPPEYTVAFLAVLVLLPFLVFRFRRNRPVLFGVAFFLINLALVLQLVTVGTAVLAERYTYLPYIGLFLAMTWWLDERPASGRGPRTGRQLLTGFFLLLALFSGIQTWRRCQVWRDPETFWTDTIQKHPGQVVAAYYNRGNYYRRTGRLEEARADYARTIALNPGIVGAWNNQGIVLALLGREDSALVYFDHVLAREPNRARTLNDRGAIRYRKGDLPGAIEDFSRAIGLDSTSWNAYGNRALAYARLGRHVEAVADRRRAVERDPSNRANPVLLGLIGDDLRALGRHREAVAAYDRAIAGSAPRDSLLAELYSGRSRAWAMLGEAEKAAADAREAARRRSLPKTEDAGPAGR